MTWKTWPIALLTLVFLLGGCGGGGGKDDDGDTGVDTEDDNVDTTTEPEDDPTPDTEPDPTGDPVTDTAEEVEEDVVEETAADAEEETPSSGVVGDPCTDADDCTSTLGIDPYCLEDVRISGGTVTLTGGYCTARCTDSGGECGTGAVCLRMGGTRRCFKECTVDGDCRESEGYECWESWTGDLICMIAP